jgi:hypothetical protein
LFFVFLAENMYFRCLGILIGIFMPAEIHIVVSQVMTRCNLVGIEQNLLLILVVVSD